MINLDLRSDTVTRPDAPMLEAMMSATVGDDVYAEDPTVNELQERLAEMFGTEAGLFVASGVMSNQLCLKALTRPGDEVIVGHESHIFNYETAAPAILSGIQLHTVAEHNGAPHPEAVTAAIREKAYYLPPTSVIAVENTHNRRGGEIADMDALLELGRIATGHGIALHLDGARIFNAMVATGLSAREITEGFTTISVCLSKGLGAPMGSVMLGSREHIALARRFRKIWGGGWRQAGIVAAAGLYALDNNIDHLRVDHELAAQFAALLSTSDSVNALNHPATNIVLFAPTHGTTDALVEGAAKLGVLLSSAFRGRVRAVFHRDVPAHRVAEAAEIVANVARKLEDAKR